MEVKPLFNSNNFVFLEHPNKFINENVTDDQVNKFLEKFQIIRDDQSITWRFSCQLFFLISTIAEEKDPESLSVNQVNAIAHAVQESAQNSIEVYIKKDANRTTYNTTSLIDEEYQKLISSLHMLHKFFSFKFIGTNCLFDDIKLDYTVGVIAAISIKKNILLQSYLQDLPHQISPEIYFKFLMMIKGFNGLSKSCQHSTHCELMRMIRSKNGFLLLCRSLLVKSDVPLWQRCSMISKIAEASIKNKESGMIMIDEVLSTHRLSLTSSDCDLTGACTVVLKNLEEKSDFKEFIRDKILEPLEKLTNPDALLFGSILMEIHELKTFTEILNALFSTSTIASMPSKMLQSSIIAIYGLYSILPDTPERDHLSNVIIFVLNNADQKELHHIIKNIRLKDDDDKVLKIHPQVIFHNNSLQIGSDGITDDSEMFLNLIRHSNNNGLLYKIFLCLINLLSDVQNSSNTFLTSYDVDEDELPGVLHRKFYKQLSLIEPLQEMIQWKALHSQLNDNPKEVLEAIKGILIKSNDGDEHIVIIFFSLFKELLNKVKNDEHRKEMKQEISKLMCRFKNKEQIASMFNTNDEVPDIDPSKIAYEDAMKLLQSREIYCKVYGSDSLIKLLKKHDNQAIINRHTILAVALKNMCESESYAYLNIIRLLVALTYVMDVEVIDALVVEYQNSENDIDERLKYGEVIIKVTEDLGEMAMKFKQQLINCFLKGSRDINDEFRTSSLANLGSICRLCSYQIHNFFHEMFLQLEGIVKSDTYMPSKRAAAMVLSQILAGLPNLMDFQSFLLPIYHLLKEILANESDDQTKLHAEIALDHLNEKTRDFLKPQLKMQKEVKIRLDENPNQIKEIKYK